MIELDPNVDDRLVKASMIRRSYSYYAENSRYDRPHTHTGREGKYRAAGIRALDMKTRSTYVLPLRTYIIHVSFKGSQTIEKVVLLLFEGFEFVAIEFVSLARRRKQRSH